MESKNQDLNDEFYAYCISHPEQRFWQALASWSNINFILKADKLDLNSGEFNNIEDTYNFTEKDK